MKIIVSPTKSMKRKDLPLSFTTPTFYKESQKLRGILQKKSKEDLKALYKASDKVVDQAYAYLHEEKDLIQALALYDGLVFKQLSLTSYSEKEMSYLEDHVLILSALYGVLKVTDAITEYRLDYLMRFETNLYDFWKDKLTTYFKGEDLVVNLASAEFSESFTHPNMVTIHFLNTQGKSLSTAAKMARGDMLDYLVTHQILDLEGIKNYNNLNYQYDEKRSTDTDLYFVMEEV